MSLAIATNNRQIPVQIVPRNDDIMEIKLLNRADPPDTMLREVHRRTGDKPFARIEDVISNAELVALSEDYKRVAGFERASLAERASLV